MATFRCWDNESVDETAPTPHEADNPKDAAEAFADSVGLTLGGITVHVRAEDNTVTVWEVEVREGKKPLTCAFCGGPAQGNYSIHRDGFGKGPEVPLCDTHGEPLKPSCAEIWARISTLPSDQW